MCRHSGSRADGPKLHPKRKGYRHMEHTTLLRAEERIPPGLRPAVAALFRAVLEARAFSGDSPDEPWSFGVEHERLLAIGDGSALEWMLREGWLAQPDENPPNGEQDTQAKESRCYYLLTASGLAVAVALRRKEWAAAEPPKPLYEPRSGRLSALGVLLHRFPRQDVNV